MSSLIRKVRRRALHSARAVHGAASQCWRMGVARRPDRSAVQANAAQLDAIRRQAEAALADNIMPFWATHAVDELNGGFVTHLDRRGQWLGTTDKYLVPQTRLVWTFAAAHRHGLVGKSYLDLAAAGASFLVDRMWDAKVGGFHWAVQRDGRPLICDKRTYGQAFAIFVITDAAAEAAIGLGLIIALFRNKETVNADEIDLLKW